MVFWSCDIENSWYCNKAYLLIKNIIINNLHVINSKLAQISDGNLDVTVDVRANQEFASLSDDINSINERFAGADSAAEINLDSRSDFLMLE